MATTKIVTEVTLEQLDALVASNSLNEGLQYNVTDKGWLLVATSATTYKFASIPYKSYSAFLTCDPITDIPIPVIVQNEIGEIIWSLENETPGQYKGTLPGAFGTQKTAVITGASFNYNTPDIVVVKSSATNDEVSITTLDSGGTSLGGELVDTFVEIRVYLI